MASMTPDKAVDVYPASASDRPLRAPRTGQRGMRSRQSERGLASVSLVSQGEKLITSTRHGLRYATSRALASASFHLVNPRTHHPTQGRTRSRLVTPSPAKPLLYRPTTTQRTVTKLLSSHMGEARNAERRWRRPSARGPRRSQQGPSISNMCALLA